MKKDLPSSSKFNEKRKEILLQLDENCNNISNINLGMYDLTSYYKPEDIACTLSEKILFIQNEKRKIRHITTNHYYFMPEQESALNFIYENDRIILSAPTSFGKTLILKEYIYRYQPKKVVFIVPTNALSYELEMNFKSNPNFKNYDIYDKNKDEYLINDDKELFIGTQEKFLEIKDNYINGIDLFVIDEAYKLKEKTTMQRGYKLSDAFINSIDKNSQKIVLLSPNAIFEGFDKYNFKLYETKFNAVDKLFYKLKINEFYDVLYEKSITSKTILYCDRPLIISNIYNKVKKIKNVDNEFIRMIENEFHPEWSVVKYLKKGIVVHHGQMPKFIQNKMIRLFNDNKSGFNLLIGTNSISEGINTPTKYLFFNPDCDLSKDELRVKNTIGRAGRLGEYPIGHIYSTDEIAKIINEKEIKVELAINNDLDEKELLDSKDDNKIIDCSKKYDLEKSFIEELIKTKNISLSRLIRIFDELKKDRKFSNDITQINDMVNNVFREEHPFYSFQDDNIYMKGVLQFYYYKKENGNSIKKQLNTYDDKIEFYRYKNNNDQSTSNIIEGYMQFTYNTLEYLICPIVDIGNAIKEKSPDWKFGKNVCGILNEFNAKYSQKIYGFKLNDFTDNQKKIIMSLKEYGVSLKNTINYEIITEIEKKLNVRFSTYDIINAIHRLSEQSEKKEIYKYLFEKYFN